MKIKIISDGTPSKTKVVTGDGHELERVKSIEWFIDATTKHATVKIEFIMVPVEIEGILQ